MIVLACAGQATAGGRNLNRGGRHDRVEGAGRAVFLAKVLIALGDVLLRRGQIGVSQDALHGERVRVVADHHRRGGVPEPLRRYLC